MEKIEEEIKDMTPKLIGEVYRKFPTIKSNQLATYGIYECPYCENTFEAIFNNVKRGNTKSCGCFTPKLNITHGMSQNKFYQTWHNMIQRCTNPNHKAYKDYGARGITVCDEWLDIVVFVVWAEATHPNIEEVTLDRIDNDKGYSPDNCTWSDKVTQVINRRIPISNKSGYVGIYYYDKYNTWGANIRINKILKQLGSFKTKEEAVQARDNYIIKHNLPHKLSTHY